MRILFLAMMVLSQAALAGNSSVPLTGAGGMTHAVGGGGGNFLLLVNGSSYLLLVNGVAKLIL